MKKFITLVSALCAMAVFALVASCGAGEGIKTSANPTATVYADLNGDGIPDQFDNCPATKTDAADLVELGIPCEASSDCLDSAGVLADGNPVPVASNKGTSSLIGVFCVAQQCVVQKDTDLDGAGDACDQDDDGDRIGDTGDNCPEASNATQANNDGGNLGDACDSDDDNDGKPDATDNCPLVANADQADTDGNGKGDVCDGDDDGDGVVDTTDNCPLVKNTNQTNTDGDEQGDVCDEDDDNDADPDVTDCADTDPTIFVGQVEDCNGVDDDCNEVVDESFADTDADTQADCVDTDDDSDGDLDATDNCPLIANADQKDTDGDGQGDLCDGDDDADGKPDATDNCPLIANADQKDTDGDGQGDLCDGDCDGDGIPNSAPCTGDLDGDGSTPPEDCLEGNGSVHPGATEICNGVDDDCNEVVDEAVTCGAGKVCGGLMGCVNDPNAPSGPECTIGADCDDGDACMDDACVGGVCSHMPKTCDDGDKCTTDSCDPATGCKMAVKTCPAGQVCTPSDGTCAAACVPACAGKQCGDDGCGGSCGSCSGTDVCDGTGMCVSAPKAGTLKVTWVFAPESIPSSITELRLMIECIDSSGKPVVFWGAKATSQKPFPTSLSYTTVAEGITSCKVNAVGLSGTSQWWAASCNGVGTCGSVGDVSYSYFDGAVTWTASKTGLADNGQGGVNWAFKPGVDTDGDGKLDASDPFPGDATK